MKGLLNMVRKKQQKGAIPLLSNVNNPILRYTGKRLLSLIPILLGITFITYALMFISPGDPVEMMLTAQGVPVSEEMVESMRADLGLDRPFLVQYFSWLFNFFTGDMGVSYISDRPVSDILLTALPKTLTLTLTSILLTIVLAIPLGILTAVRQNRFTDYLIRFLSFIGNSIPNFLLSMVLIYVFCVKLHVLPILANGSFSGLILPTVALATAMTGKYIRQVRAAVLEELSKDYVKGAVARGIKAKVILYKDVLKNAMTTIVTLLSLSIGSLLGGTAAVEMIFVWQGMGLVMIDSITTRDYPVIQAFVVWMAIIFVLVNLITDIVYYCIDPRMRQSLGGEK